MKKYQIMKLEAETKCRICELIDHYIKSEEEDIERYTNSLKDYDPEDRRNHWEAEAIEAAEQHIKFAELAMEHIMNGGKNK